MAVVHETEEVVDPNGGIECINCTHAVNLATEVDMTDDCCQGYMDILITQTSDNFELLGDSSYNHYKSLEPEEDCVECRDIVQLAYNTQCPLHKPHTCYLYGKSYNDAVYGRGGDLGYYPPKESYYSTSSSYYNNYDYNKIHDDGYGYYVGHQQHECLLETMLHHIKNVPNVCSPLASTCQECGYGEVTEPKTCVTCPKSRYTDAECDTYKRDRDACTQQSKGEYYASDASDTVADTTDKSVETVGWIMITIGGVMLLAGIAFFVAGRSERKAAAQNRIAGHGVIA